MARNGLLPSPCLLGQPPNPITSQDGHFVHADACNAPSQKTTTWSLLRRFNY